MPASHSARPLAPKDTQTHQSLHFVDVKIDCALGAILGYERGKACDGGELCVPYLVFFGNP